jgi:hypothetical protein
LRTIGSAKGGLVIDQHRRFSWPGALVALGFTLASGAQEVRLGAELQINSYTLNSQFLTSSAAAADGDFVIAWQGDDGGFSGAFAARFSSAGIPLGAEFQVNSYTTGGQYFPAVAMDPAGDFVVAWESSQDGDSEGIFARRFSSAGSALAGEFQVNSYTTAFQSRAAVAMDGDGDFVVAWQSFGQDGSLLSIFARRFSSAGTALGVELQVNSYTAGDQELPSVAADVEGDFVVAWESSGGQDGDASGVFARRFSSVGSALGSEFRVNSYTSGAQSHPTVRADADGDFVVAWDSNPSTDGSLSGVFARRFTSAGTAMATELQVNAYGTGFQKSPSLAVQGDGDFVVAWDSYGQDGSVDGIFARRFSSAGIGLASEFEANSYTLGAQQAPAVTVGVQNDFVVAWNSKYQDGSYYGVFAQRFTAPVTLDVDGDGASEPLTDGLLMLRYLFGFRGPALVVGAIDLVHCRRCDASSIEAYLAGLT